MPYEITGLAPQPMVVGDPVTADGDFGADEGLVYVGATPATITAWGASQITFTCPAVGVGDHDVQIHCVNYAAIGTPLIVGDDPPVVGNTLTCDTTGISDANGIASFAYEWQSYQEPLGWLGIDGATSSTYLVDIGDLGAPLRVEVTVTDVNGIVEDPLYSAQTQDVIDGGGTGPGEYWYAFRTEIPAAFSTAHRASIATAIDWRGYGLEMASDVPCMQGSRWNESLSAWENTEDDGSTPLPDWRRGIQMEPSATNIVGVDIQTIAWSVGTENVTITPENDYSEGDMRGIYGTVSSVSSPATIYFRTDNVGNPSGVVSLTWLIIPNHSQNVQLSLKGNNWNDGAKTNIDTSDWTVNGIAEGGSAIGVVAAMANPVLQDNSRGMATVVGDWSHWKCQLNFCDAYTSTSTDNVVYAQAGQTGPTTTMVGATMVQGQSRTTSIIRTTGSNVTRADTNLVGDITQMDPINAELGNDHSGQVIVHINNPLEFMPVGATIMEMTDTATSGATYGLRIYLSADNTFRLDSRNGYHEIVLADPGNYFTLDCRWVIRSDGTSNFWINGNAPTSSGGSAMDPASSFGRLTLGNVDTGSPSGVRMPGIYDQYRLVDEGLDDGDVLAW